jgi:hypothetical protein
MVLVAVPVMYLLSFLTPRLAALLVILFGPLIGFVLSSLYPRIEWFVGAMLGGKAPIGDLHLVFTRSFLPLSIALLLCALLCPFADTLTATPKTLTMIAASIPSLIICYRSLRFYCSNVVALRRFTKIRGAVGVLLTFALFLVVIAAAGGFLWLLSQHIGEDLGAS